MVTWNKKEINKELDKLGMANRWRNQIVNLDNFLSHDITMQLSIRADAGKTLQLHYGPGDHGPDGPEPGDILPALRRHLRAAARPHRLAGGPPHDGTGLRDRRFDGPARRRGPHNPQNRHGAAPYDRRIPGGRHLRTGVCIKGNLYEDKKCKIKPV